jgi:hypothetical protein
MENLCSPDDFNCRFGSSFNGRSCYKYPPFYEKSYVYRAMYNELPIAILTTAGSTKLHIVTACGTYDTVVNYESEHGGVVAVNANEGSVQHR